VHGDGWQQILHPMTLWMISRRSPIAERKIWHAPAMASCALARDTSTPSARILQIGSRSESIATSLSSSAASRPKLIDSSAPYFARRRHEFPGPGAERAATLG
jgi:hypothetical protein